MALLVLVLTVLAVSLLPPSQGPSFATEPARRAAVPTSTRTPTVARPTPTAKRTARRRSPKPKAARSRARARTKAKARKTARRQAARRRGKKLVKAQRVFRWRRYRAAVYYELLVQRGATTVYAARTAALSVRLPARLRLRPGTYHVVVRPGIPNDAGIILGPAIFEKTFTV